MANAVLNAQEKVKLQRAYRRASSQVNSCTDNSEAVEGLRSLLRLCGTKHLLFVLYSKEEKKDGSDSVQLRRNFRYHAHALFVEWGIVTLVTSRLIELLQCPVDEVVAEPVKICATIFLQLGGSAGDGVNVSTSYINVFFELGVPALMKDVLVRFVERAGLASVSVDCLLCLVTNDSERIVRTAQGFAVSEDLELPGTSSAVGSAEHRGYFHADNGQDTSERKEVLKAVQQCLQRHIDNASLVLTCCVFLRHTSRHWAVKDLASVDVQNDLFRVLVRYHSHEMHITHCAAVVLEAISESISRSHTRKSLFYTSERFLLLIRLIDQECDAVTDGKRKDEGDQLHRIMTLVFRFLPAMKSSVIVESEAAGILTKALRVYRSALPNLVAWVIVGIQAFVSGDSPHTDVVIKVGMHREVIACMETYASKVSTALAGTLFLWMLASDGLTKKALFQCGILPLLINTLRNFSSNRRVMYNTLGLAGSLTFVDAELRGNFLTVPYIPALKETLLVQLHSADVVRCGIASLIMLVRRQDILLELAWCGIAQLLSEVVLSHNSNSRVQRCGITLLGHLSCHVVIANLPVTSKQKEHISSTEELPVDGGIDMEIDSLSQDSMSIESTSAVCPANIYSGGAAPKGSMQCSAITNPSHTCWQLPSCAPVAEGKLYVSRLHGLNAQLCSNCKDKESLTREVIMSVNQLSVDDYQMLTDRGWFRRGSTPLYQYRHVHESHCGTYDTRTDVRLFDASTSKTNRRVLKRCRLAGVQVETVEPSFRQDAYELYNSYQVTKHDKPRKTPDGYRAHAIDTPIQPCKRAGVRYGTVHQLYWMNGRLIGVGVLDVLPHTLVSVYMYYDVVRPEVAHLSLGVYAALQEISYAQHLNKVLGAEIAYYTMGGFSPLNDKLSYKARYEPVQYLASWASSLWVDSLTTCFILAELNRVRQQLRAWRLDLSERLKKVFALVTLSTDISLLPSPTSHTLHRLPSHPQLITVQHVAEAVLEEPLDTSSLEDLPNTLGALVSLLKNHMPSSLVSRVSIFAQMTNSKSKSGCDKDKAGKNGCGDVRLTPQTELDVDTLYCALVTHSQTTGDLHQIAFRLPNEQLVHFEELSSLCRSLSPACLDILQHSVAALASGLGGEVASRTVVDLSWITCLLGKPFDTEV